MNNPGLANPEISKIIGELWREEPEDQKNQWKRLAEEEKQRHQRQYPDYRYQPRRGGKGAAARPTSASGEDPGRCPKCGGRYIATPRTPSTPFLTPTAAKPSMPPYSAPGPGSRGVEPEYHHHSSPNGMAAHPDAVRGGGGGGGGGGGSGGKFGQGGPYGHDDYEAVSPSDSKRRRFAGGYQTPQHAPSPIPAYTGHHTRQHGRTPSLGSQPSTPGYGQAGPLPGPSMLARGSPGDVSMGPPPRPPVPYQQHTPRGSSFDESLRLPPLQTQLPSSPPPEPTSSGPASIDVGQGTGSHTMQQQHQQQLQPQYSLRESQAKSIEAMVMSISYLNKLKVLEKISPPLAAPGPGSPAIETRGPVIAVEGPHAALLKQVATVVERTLAGSGECAVRVWSSGAAASRLALDDGHQDTITAIVPGSGGGSSRSGSISSTGSLATNPFGAYLQTIMEWHAKSGEMVRYVTTRPPSARGSTASASSEGQKSEASVSSAETSASERSSALPHYVASSSLHGTESTQRPPKTPVALVPSGFSLTISDRFASTVPIADSYAPVDHWQWMATLWRGIVGPDLVLYVRVAGEEEMSQAQAVELKSPGVMLVRVGEGTGLSEKTERRLGFEVLEWVRCGSFRDGFEG